MLKIPLTDKVSMLDTIQKQDLKNIPMTFIRHSSDIGREGLPSFGWLDSVKKEGEHLIGKFKECTSKAFKFIQGLQEVIMETYSDGRLRRIFCVTENAPQTLSQFADDQLTRTYTLDMETLDDFSNYSEKDKKVYYSELKLVSSTMSKNRILNSQTKESEAMKTFSENGKLYVKTSGGDILEARSYSSYTEKEKQILDDEMKKQKLKNRDKEIDLTEETDKDQIISDLKARVAELEAQLALAQGNDNELK